MNKQERKANKRLNEVLNNISGNKKVKKPAPKQEKVFKTALLTKNIKATNGSMLISGQCVLCKSLLDNDLLKYVLPMEEKLLRKQKT